MSAASSVRTASVLGLVAAAASAGYLLVATRVRRGATRAIDQRARRAIQRTARAPVTTLARATGPIGKWYGYVPLALIGGAALIATRRRAAGGTLVVSSLGAALASRALERAHAHRTPPPGKHDPRAQSFPSNHAIETTAVALTASWVLAREAVAPPVLLASLAVLASLTSGLGRLVLDRHWATDAIAGYSAGIAIAAACAAGYEATASRLTDL